MSSCGAGPRSRKGGIAGLVLLLIAVGLWSPWRPDDDVGKRDRDWITLAEFLGPAIRVPDELSGVEVLSSATTSQTRRLIESAVETYDKSLQFYATAEEAAGELELRTPEAGETVVLLVSDRHDNIGMDAVARAIGDRAGATAVFDAGDDTSTGSKWEAFSLDSLTAAFDDLDARYAVPGNHDHGSFVGSYLADSGWTVLNEEVVDGPGDFRMLGVPDPRSSGLGTWRDETGLSFDEVGTKLADAACAADDDGDRVGTILVHDANLADEALERGCVDLVLAGHLHNQKGPTLVTGENGETGYSFTTGTTGGAAYAFALGVTIKRMAQVTLVTYAEDGTAGGAAASGAPAGRAVRGRRLHHPGLLTLCESCLSRRPDCDTVGEPRVLDATALRCAHGYDYEGTTGRSSELPRSPSTASWAPRWSR